MLLQIATCKLQTSKKTGDFGLQTMVAWFGCFPTWTTRGDTIKGEKALRKSSLLLSITILVKVHHFNAQIIAPVGLKWLEKWILWFVPFDLYLFCIAFEWATWIASFFLWCVSSHWENVKTKGNANECIHINFRSKHSTFTIHHSLFFLPPIQWPVAFNFIEIAI